MVGTATRTGLATAIRVISALAVIGSSVAVTALTVDDGENVAVVVSQAAPPAQAPAAAVAPAPVKPPPPPVAAAPVNPAAPAGPAPGASVPLSAPKPGGVAPAAPGVPGAPAAPAVTINPGTGPNAAQPIAPGGQGSANALLSQPAKPQPKCPLGWPAPIAQGGLASLIGLAPLAGPFSSEAFAMGTVYQPILQLVGPVLAEIAPVIAQYQPVINPFIAQVQGVEAVVLEAILPYYGPYREQLIRAEGEFAKVLTPILDNIYNSEAASCFVAWQGQLIEQAKGGTVKVASLAHPGQIVELGP